MDGLRRDIADFHAGKEAQIIEARQKLAVQLACHVDLREAMASAPEARRRLLIRLERAIERERLRGIAKHWNYDLDRHIGLKQALDLFRGRSINGAPRARKCRRPKKQTAPEGAA